MSKEFYKTSSTSKILLLVIGFAGGFGRIKYFLFSFLQMARNRKRHEYHMFLRQARWKPSISSKNGENLKILKELKSEHKLKSNEIQHESPKCWNLISYIKRVMKSVVLDPLTYRPATQMYISFCVQFWISLKPIRRSPCKLTSPKIK